MAVNEVVVACVPGAWTQICQLMPNRKAMIVQLVGGVAILGINTNVPSEDTDFGNLPCGVFHSCESGTGPGQFRLSEAVDYDLVHQAWWAWIQPVSVGLPQAGSVPFTALPAGTTTLTFNISDLLVAYFAVMVTGTGPTMPVVSTFQAGLLSPFLFQTITDGLGDSAILAIFTYQLTALTDTISITLAGADQGTCVGMFVTGIGQDVQGEVAAVGASLVVPTVGPPSFPNEGAVSACVSLNSAGGDAPSAGWTALGASAGPVVSPSGSSWLLSAAMSFPTIPVPDTITWTGGAGTAQMMGDLLIALVITPPIQTTLVTVIESFEIVVPPVIRKFNVALPKLSPDAIKALNGLLAEMEQYNEAENAGIYQHGNSRHGGGGASQAESAP